jgi:hypothetical protein
VGPEHEDGLLGSLVKRHDFRQVGLLVNPTALSTYPAPANGAIYKTTTDVVVAPGFGVFAEDGKTFTEREKPIVSDSASANFFTIS